MSDLFLQIPLRGAQLIEANAGTGKTYTIALLVLRALVDGLDDDSSGVLEARNLLVTTFTRNAADELKERIRSFLMLGIRLLDRWPEQLPEDADLGNCYRILLAAGGQDTQKNRVIRERLARALAGFDEACISTLHSFCQQVLGDNRLLSGLEVDAEISAQDGWLERIARDFWRAENAMAAELPPLSLDEVVARARMMAQFDAVTERMVGVSDVAPASDLAALRKDFESCAGQLREALESLWTFLMETKGPRNRKPCTRWQTLKDDLSWHGWCRMGGAVQDGGVDIGSRAFLETSYKAEDVSTFADSPIPDLIARMAGLAQQSQQHQAFRWFRLYEAVREAQQQRIAGHSLDFDALIRILRDCLRDPEQGQELVQRLRDRYRLAIIDEFQDTDPAQFEIINRIYLTEDNAATLILVGDPKQSIYRFRNADVHSYLAAHKQIAQRENGAIHHLKNNYRSSKRMVEALNHLYAQRPQPQDEDPLGPIFAKMQPSQPVAGKGSTLFYAGEKAAALRICLNRKKDTGAAAVTGLGSHDHLRAQMTANQVVYLLAKGELEDAAGCHRALQEQDILILCGSHNNGALIQHALAQRGVVSARAGKEKVWETAEAESLSVLLAALHNPEPAAVRRALATPLFAHSAEDLQAWGEAEERWWLDRFRLAWSLWERSNLLSAVHDLFADRGGGGSVWSQLLTAADGRRRVANLRQLLELLQVDEQRLELTPEGVLQRLQRYRSGELSVGDDEKLRLEEDGEVVRIMTIHAAKGLEAPVVILSDLHKGLGRFGARPPLRLSGVEGALVEAGLGAQHPQRLLLFEQKQLANAELVKLAETESLTERDRMLYVALTRASAHTLIIWGEKDADSSLARLLGDPFSDARRYDALNAIPGVEATFWTPSPEAVVRDATVSEKLSYQATKWQRPAMWIPQRVISYSAMRSDQAIPVTVADTVDELWSQFKKGNLTGSFFHQVFELVVPGRQQVSMEEALDVAWRRCPPPPADGADHESMQQAAIGIVSDWMVRPVLGDRALRDLDADRTFEELNFHLPLRSGLAPGPELSEALSQGDLPLASGVEWEPFCRNLTATSTEKIRGFLTGSIDLLSVGGVGNWTIVDYKTTTLTHYNTGSLGRAMVQHDYLLQLLLYGVAARRFLRSLGAQTGQGEGCYLFLRGSAGEGVFSLPLSESLLDRLEPLFSAEVL